MRKVKTNWNSGQIRIIVPLNKGESLYLFTFKLYLNFGISDIKNRNDEA